MNEILDMREDTTTYETRRRSYEEVLETLGVRQRKVLEALNSIGTGCTAKELAVFMFENGTYYSSERNATHPRLNELVKLDYVKITGKRRCEHSGKSATVYSPRISGEKE